MLLLGIDGAGKVRAASENVSSHQHNVDLSNPTQKHGKSSCFCKPV